MGLSVKQLKSSIDTLATCEPAFAEGLKRAGYPKPRIRKPGYETLLRTIIGQQVSVSAATSIWNKLAAKVGDLTDPENIAVASGEALRTSGLSRQKVSYARSLSSEVSSGHLDLGNLSKDDEEAITQLMQVKGIGHWSAEIYLLLAEGRADIWPAGDLAVQIEIGRILGYEKRPSEKQLRTLAEAWRPHRGAAAIFAWHHYKVDMNVI
jgi:DNA-3-methyladenine glycosylase II